jgi:hypothetical protein
MAPSGGREDKLPVHGAEAPFRFAKQQAGLSHFAEVTVRAATSVSGGFELRISPLAFDWLREVYGPQASEWAVCDEFRGRAVRGVAYALQHTRTPVNWQLTIEVVRIRARPPDTTADDVALATCFATWQACGLEPSMTPRLEDKVVVFP